MSARLDAQITALRVKLAEAEARKRKRESAAALRRKIVAGALLLDHPAAFGLSAADVRTRLAALASGRDRALFLDDAPAEPAPADA